MISTFSIPSEKLQFSRFLLFSIIVVFLGCSKDDLEETKDPFYKDALSSADIDLLAGTWAIHEVAYDGQRAFVPANYQECGRDFFQFLSNGTYRDYLILSSYDCKKQVQELEWQIDEGVLSLQNSLGQTEEMVILRLDEEKLVFKMKVDFDEDGELDVLTFGARHHTPPDDPDLYTYSFGSETIDSSEDKIKFTWLAYEGFYEFDRYEIYRSDTGCGKANAQLVATIEDSSQNFFTDENPPVGEKICYYFKIYNENGLIGESQMATFYTEFLRPAEVEFINVEVLNNEVNLEWQPYQGNYFSHYEIKVRNYKDGTAYRYQEYPVKIIANKEVATFLDENPPRLKNPVYAIYAYDIFGNVSSSHNTDKNAWELKWIHPEVLNFDLVRFVTVDPDSPEIFLYGRASGSKFNLIKYNYLNNEISAIVNKSPEGSTSISMQVHTSENGKELFFAQGNALAVYDASDLSYKYELKLGNSPFFSDFAYLGNNIFSFTTSQSIYTFKRTNANLEPIAKKDHFSTHFGSGNYHLIPLKNEEIMVGHFQEPRSFKFSINATGEISNGELVDIPIKSPFKKETLYSPEKDYIINLLENRFYSTTSFSLQDSFENPYFPSGISRDGNLILGSNNDPQESITYESIHEKKARIYNLTTGKLTTIETKGYPHLLFEDHLGQIISISSDFKREKLESLAPKPDIFVEVIQ